MSSNNRCQKQCVEVLTRPGIAAFLERAVSTEETEGQAWLRGMIFSALNHFLMEKKRTDDPVELETLKQEVGVEITQTRHASAALKTFEDLQTDLYHLDDLRLRVH